MHSINTILSMHPIKTLYSSRLTLQSNEYPRRQQQPQPLLRKQNNKLNINKEYTTFSILGDLFSISIDLYIRFKAVS